MRSVLSLYCMLMFYGMIISISCSQSNQEALTGIYVNEKLSPFEMIFSERYDGYVTGSSLLLKEESTFTYHTCSVLMEGRWTTHRDSVFLHALSSRLKTDSLEQYGFYGRFPDAPVSPLVFLVNDNKLIQTTSDTIEGIGRSYLNTLSK